MLLILTHISLASFLWDKGKQCKPRSEATKHDADQGLHCLLTEKLIKIWIEMKNSTQQPLKQKWTGPINKGRQVQSA